MSRSNPKIPPLQAGLLAALSALDNQVARDMQRSPQEIEREGVNKWAVYERKIEEVANILLDEFESKNIELDGLLITAAALTKSMQIIVEDLGSDNLGKMRTDYCRKISNSIADTIRRVQAVLNDSHELN